MCSVQYLREFIKERLTAACEEIFSEVQKIIVQYEEEINSQRRLLDISRKPGTNSHIVEYFPQDLPQQHDCEEEEGLDVQQVCNQERNSSLDQEDPEPPQIKEEQEELCSSQEGEQLGLKQEAEGIWTDEEQLRPQETIWKPEIKSDTIDLQQQHVYEEEVLTEQQICNQERNSSLDQEDPEPPRIKEEQEELCSSHEGEQLGQKQGADTFMVTPTYEENDHSEAEPNSEELLSHSSPEAKSRDEEESQHVDLGLIGNAELKKRRHHSQSVVNTPVSESQSETDARTKSLKCNTCGKNFHYKSHLTTHLRVHTGEKPYPCSTCGKKFSQKSALKTHLKSHTAEKFHCCNSCGKRFADSSAIMKRMRFYTGEKPYSCSNCGKKFSQKSALETHVRIHTGEKPYSCSTCGKKFSQKSTLKTHVRIHTGEKPHSCNTCGKRFSQRIHLKKHMRIHAG